MKTIRLIACATVVLGTAASWQSEAARASEPVKVVATFSILADMTKNVGGDRVSVTALVKAGGDPHVYQPTPSDANSIAKAKLLIENGIGFEGWIDRLIKASGYNGPRIVATKGIAIRTIDEEHGGHHDDEKHAGHGKDEKHADHHDDDKHAGHHGHKEGHKEAKAEHGHHHGHAHHHGEGGKDPHAWLVPANAKIYANNIRDGLCQIDADGCATYTANAKTYSEALTKLGAEIEAMFNKIPADQRRVVVSHDAFGYFGDTYGLELMSPVGFSTDAEASAKDVARIIRNVRSKKVSGLFVENIADPRLVQQIARETGIKVGGKLYPGSLSDASGPASTYIELMRHNAHTITTALAASGKP